MRVKVLIDEVLRKSPTCAVYLTAVTVDGVASLIIANTL